MRNLMAGLTVAGLLAVAASSALAAEPASARDIQAAVDSYVASAGQDASLVGGPGSAGYDAGFWIRGGDFSLRINATIQARFEAVDWDTREPGDAGTVDLVGLGGGDRSGFALPRATLKFSGTAPCNTRYYIELDFGHFGREATDRLRGIAAGALGTERQSWNFDNTREAWVEWGCSNALNFRMGQIKIPTTRQLMTPPELQQFVDVSYASAWTSALLPGMTDRNRDHGAMFHGAFGCESEFSWMFAVTNNDGGDSIRNVFDGRTEDALAFSGRLNWAFLGAIGYEEGALRQNTCTWYGELGGWGYYTTESLDKPKTDFGEHLRAGADLALGYGGLSMTGAWTYFDSAFDAGAADYNGWIALAQIGYLFPDTAWEIAFRWSHVNNSGARVGKVDELAGAINYYMNGHGNKFTLDLSYVQPDGINTDLFSPYPGYADFQSIGATGITDNSYFLIRFQWQLAL